MGLSEKQEEIISDALLPLFQYLENQVIVDVARRIQSTMKYTRTAELMVESMQRLGYSPAKIRAEAMKRLKADSTYRKEVAKNTLEHKKTIKKLLKEIVAEALKKNDTLMADCGDMSYFDDLKIWKQGGRELTDKSYLPQLVNAIRKQTSDAIKNLTQTTGFKTMSGYEAMENLYQRELDKAMIKLCTGTFSKEQIVYETVHSLADSGLRSIDFSSGWSMQLDTAVKLAIRTGSHQLSGKIKDANITQTGENLVYVSKHWGARNEGIGHANHEQWQGRVYFIKEGINYSEEAKRIGQDNITSLWLATGYSVDGAHENDPLGLNGYNCRHSHYVWFEGISNYPDEDPEPKPVTIKGKKYDYYALTQKQRAMERSVRALKREREALKKLDMDTKDITKKIRRKIAEYEEFCKNTKVKANINRMRYEPGTSNLKKTKAWKEYGEMKAAAGEGMKLSFPEDVYKVNGITESVKTELDNAMKKLNNEYDIRLNSIVVEPAGKGDIFITGYHDGVVDMVVNQNIDFDRVQSTIVKKYNSGIYAGKSLEDYLAHEMAHCMMYQDCTSDNQYYARYQQIESLYVHLQGISGYADKMKSGNEALAEAFVRVRNNEEVSPMAKILVETYYGKWKK